MRPTSVAMTANTTSALTHMTSYEGKRVIMTGGTGDIGNTVFNELAAIPGIKIVVFSRQPKSIRAASNVSI